MVAAAFVPPSSGSRLMPAALLVIVVTLALSALIVSPLRLTEIATEKNSTIIFPVPLDLLKPFIDKDKQPD